MPHKHEPGHFDAPVADPCRNAELLMQCFKLTDGDCAYTTHGKNLAEQIEVARCMFCSKKAPDLQAPWGAITVPDLQAWYDWHGEKINAVDAKRQIEAGRKMRVSDDYDVRMKVGVASRSVDAFAPKKYPYYAGMIWRAYRIYKLSIVETADRYQIDPTRVREIFEDPEWFVNTDRYDYQGRYAVITPKGKRHVHGEQFYDQIHRVAVNNLPQPALEPGDLL